jgi:hypothetical protein
VVVTRNRIPVRSAIIDRRGRINVECGTATAKQAKKAKAQKERRRTQCEFTAADLRELADLLLVLDKCEELYGRGDADGKYTIDQLETAADIVDEYTPEQRQVAIKLAKAVNLAKPEVNTAGVDHYEMRQRVRRQLSQASE